MEEKMVKHIYIIIFVFLGSIFMNACLNIEPKGGGYIQTASRGSQISKSKGVFMNYYDMQEPFEYKDSIIYLKLVFNDVFSEITHNKFDSAYSVIDSSGNQYFPQTFIAVLDTVNSEIDWCKEPEISKKMAGISRDLKFSFEKRYVLRIGKQSINIGLISFNIWPPFIGMPRSTPNIDTYPSYLYEKIPDTLKVEVCANYEYKKLCGLEKDKKIVFGEMVFVKRLDTVQREFETAENKRKKKNLFKKNNKVVLVYKSTPQ
ncbi:MAG: hypothetical protein IKY22_03130 [Bacteroidales bacterium]|nr:hypothetical protein [Bacteroidales bacterium]